MVPNGYNMTPGGENPPVFHGEEHPLCAHSKEEVELIKNLLRKTKLTIKKIAEVTNYSTSSINRINLGKLWFDETEEYPIRKEGTVEDKKERCENIINDLLNTTLTQQEIAKKYGVSRTAVTAINNGQNYKKSNLEYPLRKTKMKSNNQ